MRRTLCLLTAFTVIFTLTASFAVLGQGTVVLNNRVTGTVISHVYFGCPAINGNSTNDFPAGTNSYYGYALTGASGLNGQNGAGTTFATLLGASGSNVPEASLVASITPPTTFRTGGAAGNVAAVTDVFSNIPPDAPVATFQMVVWDNSSGLYNTWALASTADIAKGWSVPIVLTHIGGGTNPAPFLTNLASFTWGYLECSPHILYEPVSQAAVPGGTATFSVGALTWTGYTNYQWYFNSNAIFGATNAAYSIHDVQVSNFGPYQVVVRNYNSSENPPQPGTAATSSIANLHLAASPIITNLNLDSSARFSFLTEVGPEYVSEFKTAVSDPGWTQFSTNSGTGAAISVTNSPLNPASRFYRVRLY